MKPVPKPKLSHKKKRILVVDDHPLMREGVTQWIQRAEDMEVCGEAESAEEALSLVNELKPDLVVTDITLIGKSGTELIKDLHTLHPELPTVVLSMHDESLYAGHALRAGARGYVMKRAGGGRVVDAIREVLNGRIAVSSKIATSLLERISGQRSRSGQTGLFHLTDRELEILQLFGEAKTSREIARQLHLSPKTVDTHRMNLVRKLKLKNQAELMRFAFKYVEGEGVFQ